MFERRWEAHMTEHAKPWRKITLYGVAVWAVPFVLSLALFTPEGQPRFSEDLFESAMAVSLAGITSLMSYRLFKPSVSIGVSGLTVGLVWLAISVLIDIPTIILGLGMSPAQYAIDVALSYLLIPAITIAVGKTARARHKAVT
jgi:hypothetical protein